MNALNQTQCNAINGGANTEPPAGEIIRVDGIEGYEQPTCPTMSMTDEDI